MLTDEELAVRRTTVGASDVLKLMNFDTKGVRDLFEFKIGLTTPPQLDNKYITFGNLTEESCMKFAMKDLDYTLNERVEHKDIKNFIVSTDGLVGNIPYENKGKNAKGFDKLVKADREHEIQVMAQLSCVGGNHAYIVYNRAADEDYEHPILYEPSEDKQKVFMIERNEEMIENIELRVSYFLECMETKEYPSEEKYREWKGK